MDGWLKQSTAIDLRIGPFLDETTGKDAEAGLTVTQAEVRLSKAGGDFAQKNEATSLVHDELGYYICKLDTDDTDTLGMLKLAVHESGALPVWHSWMVLPANVWDSFFGADALQVHAVEITAGLITATALGADCITSAKIADNALANEHFADGALTSTEITSAAGCVVASIAENAITGAALHADACTKIIDDFETQSQADPTGFHVNVKEVNGTAQTANDMSGDIDDILTDTAELGAAVGASISADIAAVQTSADAAAAWGSINSGIVFRGLATAGDTTHATIGGLAGQGAGAFVDATTPWYLYVFRDAGGVGGAPQGETRTVSAYNNATGEFTVSAVFTEAIAAGDDIIIMSGRIAAIPEIKAVVDDILIDTAEIGAAGVGLTAITDDTSQIGALGVGLTAITDDTSQIGALGVGLTAITDDTSQIGAAGVGLTEAGGDGDHLTEAGGDGDHLVEAGGTGDQFTAIPESSSFGIASALTLDFGTLLERLYQMVNNKMIVTEASGDVALRNLADNADVATGNVQDLGATTQRNALSW